MERWKTWALPVSKSFGGEPWECVRDVLPEGLKFVHLVKGLFVLLV